MDNNKTQENINSIINSISDVPTAEIKERLVMLINDLINNDFPALIQLLYRIDVSESRLKTVLKQNANTDAASLIADLIISRQLQKIAYKKQYNSNEKMQAEDIL